MRKGRGRCKSIYIEKARMKTGPPQLVVPEQIEENKYQRIRRRGRVLDKEGH